jgi:hypothetical protein
MKSAMGKKTNSSTDGDNYLVECLRSTLTRNSNITLVCTVNPSPNHYEHSLPAVKFCARIRDSIMKKQITKGSRHEKVKNQTSSRVRVEGTMTLIKKAISDLKEELASH